MVVYWFAIDGGSRFLADDGLCNAPGAMSLALTYIHVSDIHFGQEKGSEVYVHDDVKDCLIADAAEMQAAEGIQRMDGVIVTGDVAFSGKAGEYDRAGEWLDRLTESIGCQKPDVMVVPGNHDIDRDRISAGAKLMLERMLEGGDCELHRFLADEGDREILYAKFADYRAFAEGYDCGLEPDGGVAIERRVEIAAGRSLRFVGLNSALLCGEQHEDGRLLLGGKQRVMPRRTGEELVVLCHHPLESLQDAELASRYVRTRARVHIYGHVHKPSLSIEEPEGNGDVLTLSAGAVVPPKSVDGYTYTYNLVQFKWDPQTGGLKVVILPRRWNENATKFDSDTEQLGQERVEAVLRCPNFEKVGEVVGRQITGSGKRPVEATKKPHDRKGGVRGGKEMDSGRELLRLHFFRDLTAGQRTRALIEVGVLPESWTITLTHSIERRLLDRALGMGRQEELEKAVARVRAETLEATAGEEG